MTNLQNKKILLGITGSIAAYKSAELIRSLKELDVEVRVIMTESAKAFITPMTVQTLSGHRVHESLLDVESEATMSHISLARWADLILIAPASANCIAKLAAGFADDLLTTACLASTAPIAIAPAMNVAMWSNPVTTNNIKKLFERDVSILGPAAGIQACGETGEGRMVEPEDIIRELELFFQQTQTLFGKKIVITAGPTQEAIDPVRYLTNHSSGKMGYAIAEAAAQAGAEVILISGPTALIISNTIKKIEITTTEQMLNAVMAEIENCDIFISTAAVADYKIKNSSATKIKKTNATLNLELERNPDILLSVSKLKSRPFLVGFAAETENLIEHAKNKLREKKLDMIAANLVDENKGFNSEYNELTVITAKNENRAVTLSYKPKKQLAKDFMEIVTQLFLNSKIKSL